MRVIRILSLDGGGTRGMFSATFLEKFCNQAGINGNELWKYFNVIAGTSIGGIQALAYSNGISPKDMIKLLADNGEKIFTIRSGVCTIIPGIENCVGPAGAISLGKVLAVPGYNCYLYDSAPLRTLLLNVLGKTKMFQLKTNVLITSVGFTGGTTDDGINFPYGSNEEAITSVTYNRFSNILIPGFTSGVNYLCSDVGVATGSAPVYFPPTQITGAPNDTWYIDGGLYQNNPTALAYTFSNILFQGKVKVCILSVGTGYDLPNTKVEASATKEQTEQSEQGVKLLFSNGLDLMGNSLSMTLLGAQEAVNEQFQTISLYNGVASNLYYYRFQAFLANKELSQLDNPTPAATKYLQDSVDKQYAIDQLKITAFIENAGF